VNLDIQKKSEENVKSGIEGLIPSTVT